ncbi:MAG TPA: protein kinase [Gemmatimonadaceae bacterium]|nr:protein kinase [Gemmatimonadaceae bacterium]
MTELRDQIQRTLGAAFTIERELGGGGMSRTLLARDNALGRLVVVKVLPPELAATVSVDRFRREIGLAVSLQHPHIVGVLSAGQADGLPFFVMPYVEGESLRARLERGPLPIVEAVRILRDVARALAYAHARGIVHRDIKPDNILLSGGSAMVADLGVAKALDSARVGPFATPDRTITHAGTSMGTPAYMAPEQVAADPASDHRADLYALGIVGYEMLAGRPPFSGSTPQALLAAQLTEAPRSLAGHRPDVPAALNDLILWCLRKDPSARPQSAEEVIAALEDPAVVSGAFVAPVTPGAVRAPAGSRRSPRLLAAVAGGALLLLAGGGYLARSWLRGGDGAAVTGGVAGPSAAAPRSVAVLPFVSLGRDSTDQYFAAGMTEDITNRLTRIPGLRVASRTAVSATRAHAPSTVDLGRALSVATLLEGTVQRDGARVRLTARLFNAGDGLTLWSDVFESAAKDVFVLQDEISSAVAAALGERLAAGAGAAGAEARRGTENAEAYNDYLRGRYFVERRGEEPLRKALQYFQRAIALDSGYALAHAGLADVYAVIPLYGGMPSREAWPLGLAAAARAIALDSTLAEGYAARGAILTAQWRFPDAERDLRRAVALGPAYAPAHQWLGELLLVRGSVDEAVKVLARAAELSPTSPVVQGSYAVALGAAGRSDDAIARGEQAVDLDPELWLTRMMLGVVHLYAAREISALRELEAALALAKGADVVTGVLGYGYAAVGERPRALELLRKLERAKDGPQQASAIARIHLGLGDTAQALTWLERAAVRHDAMFATEALAAPMWDRVRGSARFARIVRDVGLPDAVIAGRPAGRGR